MSWRCFILIVGVMHWTPSIDAQPLPIANLDRSDEAEADNSGRNVSGRFGVTNLTRGIRFEGNFSAIAQAPSDPSRLYLGTARGRVHVSKDGGLSWEETTIHTYKETFVGSLRGFEVPKNSLTRPLGITPLSATRMNQFYLPSRLFNAEITTGTDVQPPSTAFFDDGSELARATRGLSPGRLRDPVQSMVRSIYSDQTTPDSLGFKDNDAGGGSDLAIGIRARAPWLAYQVRKRRGWGLGINLMQSLFLKGKPSTEVRFLDVSPRNPEEVLAATMDGLYRSTDGGYAWSLVLTGANPRERQITMLKRHPEQANLVYAGTAQGLKRSFDGGETWKKVTHRLTETSHVLWVEFDPDNPKRLFVSVNWGALMSDDGGQTFSLIFIRPWPSLSYVRVIRPDPVHRGWIWIGTYDGLLLSRNDGKTFDRVGGLLFIGQRISRIVFGHTPGRLYTSTGTAVWASDDDGANWRFVEYGAKTWWIEAMIEDLNNPDGLFIATAHELLRYGAKTMVRFVAQGVERFRSQLAFEPTMGAVITKGLKKAGLDRAELMEFRRGSRDADYYPHLHFVAKVGQYQTERAFLNPVIDDQRSLEERIADASPLFWGVFLKWDLQELTFSTSEVITRRIARRNLWAERNLRNQIIALYEERQRLMFERVAVEQSPKQRLFTALRLEELTAHLNQITGNMFAPFEAF
jgi:photosystem II stability/assembly factor-like uncharacterized protein